MLPAERVSYKRIAIYTALILATLTVVYVVYRLNQVVLLFVLSVVVAAALRRPMLALQHRGLSRGVAIALLYLLVLAVLGVCLFVLGTPLAAEFKRASQRFPILYDILVSRWRVSGEEWQQTIANSLPHTDQIVESVGERGTQFAYQLAGFTYGVFNVAISLLAILTLTFYWLIDEDRFVRLWLMLLPVQQRLVARDTWHKIEAGIGSFVRSEAVQFVLTLLFLWLGLSALGAPYPATWALWGALAQLIPWVGIPLTLLPAVPMLLMNGGLTVAAAVALIIFVGIVMDRVIEPRLGVRGIVHPIVTVLALMILGEAAGLLGMIVALPLAAALQSVLRQMVHMNTAPRPTAQSVYSTQLQDLRSRIVRLHSRVPADPERRRAVEGMFQRVEALLELTEQEIKERATPAEQRRMPSSTEWKNRVPAIFARHRSS